MLSSRRLVHALTFLLTAVLLPLRARADDWPQFLGPERNGVSRETGLARSWPADGPRVLWTIEVGRGFAAASVRDGMVYLLDRPDDRQDVLRCLELETGRPLWSLGYDAPGTLPYNGSRNAPTVDERFIFTVGPFGHVRCIDRRSRQVVWSAHLVDDFKDPQIDRPTPPRGRAEELERTQLPRWGMTQSPLIVGDLIVLAPQTQKVGLVAYERGTGRRRWTSPCIGRNWFSYVSPTLMTLGGQQQIIMLGQPSDPEKAPEDAPPAIVSSIDPADGRLLWSTLTPRPYKIPIPQPVQIGADRMLITGGLGTGCMILQVRPEAGVWNCQWPHSAKTFSAYMHTPALWQDHLYLSSVSDAGITGVGLVCADLDGTLRWQSGRRQQFDLGPFLVADGLIFALHGKTGELHLIEASPEAFKPLARAKVLEADGGTAWAPMALSAGRLLVRDLRQMKCLVVSRE